LGRACGRYKKNPHKSGKSVIFWKNAMFRQKLSISVFYLGEQTRTKMNTTDGNQNNKLVVIPGAKPGHDVPPLDAVASLSLYEVNQEILQGKIPQTVYLKKGRIVVGRGSQSDIILNAQRDGKFIISRNHAAFQIDDDSCVLEDLGAVNGTYINGMRINKYEVKNGDIVQFGGMCDIPAGFILQHSDVSVKYKFHFLPKSVPPLPVTRSISATKANKRNRETASTPVATAVANEMVSETTNSSSGQKNNNDNKIPATTTATIANNSSGNSKTNKKAKTNNSFVSSSTQNNIINNSTSNNAGNTVVVPPSENLQEMRISDSGPLLSSSSHNNHNTSVVLEEIQSMKTIQQKEMAELKKQLFSLQQTISKSEEQQQQQQQQQLIARQQQQATSLPATPIGVGKEELLEKENQRLKEEIDLLRKKEQEREKEKEKEQATALKEEKDKNKNKDKDTHRTPSGVTKNNLNKNNSTTTKTTKEEKSLAVQPSSSSGSSSSCQIDLGSLRSPLNCILCHEFLLDAAVLRCSHGFCRLCIEKHVRLGKSTCPICNDPPLPLSNNNKSNNKKKDSSSSSVSRDLKHFYHRSDQLDSLVWILLEASPEEDRQVMINNCSLE
jgi:hypothetical protein